MVNSSLYHGVLKACPETWCSVSLMSGDMTLFAYFVDVSFRGDGVVWIVTR